MRESQNDSGIGSVDSPTPDAGVECTAACGTTSTETRFTALALLYGAPPPSWCHAPIYNNVVPLAFRMAAEKFFSPAEMARVGLARFAFDFAWWYYRENHKGQSA